MLIVVTSIPGSNKILSIFPYGHFDISFRIITFIQMNVICIIIIKWSQTVFEKHRKFESLCYTPEINNTLYVTRI